MEKAEFSEIMEDGLKKLKLPYTEKIITDYWLYMNFLIQENKKYNLTGITSPQEIITKHFLDSLAPLKFMDIKAGERILDMGTGAGFPGLVLKILKPELDLLLLDSTLKKIKFLQLLSAKLNIKKGLKLIHARAENIAQESKYRESFSIVLARAVAPLNILCEYSLPFLQKGGSAFFYKGPEYEEELKNGLHAVQLMGAEIQKIERLKVPGLRGERYLLLIKKNQSTPASYPRRAGIPKKRPL